MPTMTAVQISRPGGDFEVVEREVPLPGPRQVRLKVEACGVCHSDVAIKGGIFSWLSYPRIPGHEVVGTVGEVGAEVTTWKPGERVGVGWHGGHCFVCEACREGDFMTCENPQVTGILFDGGYAEYMIAPQEGLARVPSVLSAVEAAPLLCAGITCFNVLRHSGAGPGDLVAVKGLGKLGHLGIQYAKKSGFKTVAISGGAGKREFAKELGADIYIDASAEDPAEALQRLGAHRWSWQPRRTVLRCRAF